MSLRRSTSLLVVVGVATALTSTTSASALSLPGDVAASTRVAKLSCQIQIVGVNTDRELITRVLTNKTVDEEKSTRALPLNPKALALFAFKALQHGYTMSVRAINPGHHPSVITVTQLDSRPGLTFTNKRMRNSAFNPHVFAGSGGYHVFAVSANGKVVKRWSTIEDRRGRLSYDDPKLVTSHAPQIRTLTLSARKKLHGVATDVLWGTTVDGALFQLRVPVDHPSRAKVAIVKKSGFESVTSLSTSYCGQHPSTLSFLAISRTDDTATWYTVADQFSPRSKNVTDHGLAGEGADWRLHATF